MDVDKALVSGTFLAALFLFVNCSDDPGSSSGPEPPPEDPTGSIPEVIEPDIFIEVPGTKISQLIGDYDREREKSTQNQTYSRYQLRSTDLGVPFQDGERTYILFGDTHGAVGNDRDAIAYTTDTDPEDDLTLDFIADEHGNYLPIDIPGISQAAFEVPAEGLMVNDEMYVYHTTDHNPPVTMGRSVLARLDNLKNAKFEYLHDFSVQYFINLSIVKTSAGDWEQLPEDDGEGLVIFGSGRYRESNVYLAYQPASEIEKSEAIRYFAGINDSGDPVWSSEEVHSVPLFDQPCVGELSVSYNEYIDRWILLYNCGDPRGINMRTAEAPWGPWTEPQVLFEPWEDGGYCHFMHASWQYEKCDSVHDAGRENEWGGEYGPYQFEHFATGDSLTTTLYFTMSTWNPYTVVLMKAVLKKQNSLKQKKYD